MHPPIYQFVSKPIDVTTPEKKRKSLEQGAQESRKTVYRCNGAEPMCIAAGPPIATAKMDVDQATLDAMQKTQLRLIN
jgi:hypothetical protein